MKKVFLNCLIFSHINFIGCYSSRAVDKEILFSKDRTEPIDELTIITKENKIFKIDEIIYQVVDDTLYADGINKTNTDVYGQAINLRLALSDINYVEINDLNVSRTVGCVITSAGLILLIIGLIAAVSTTEKAPQKCEYEGFED
jgi:hypothetical protein